MRFLALSAILRQQIVSLGTVSNLSSSKTLQTQTIVLLAALAACFTTRDREIG
jgi:hypothetical protein